jgi:hypothetical protein
VLSGVRMTESGRTTSNETGAFVGGRAPRGRTNPIARGNRVSVAAFAAKLVGHSIHSDT